MTKSAGKKPETKCNGNCVIQFGPQQTERYNISKMIYQRGLSYIPKLISFDDDTKTITIQKIGKNLNEKYDNSERQRYLPKMRTLSKKFYNSFGLYHNDLHYHNILEDSNKNLYLIDFEYSSKKRGDVDKGGYRKKGKLYNFNL